MPQFLRYAAGLLVAGLLLNVAPQATAQTAPGKSKTTVKATTKTVASKKKRKTPVRPVASAAKAPAVAAPTDAMTASQQEVLTAREEMAEAGKQALGAGQAREIGGGMMMASRSVVDNLRLSMDHTIFYDALRTAGLLEKIRNEKVTVFAPTNEAILADVAMVKMWTSAPSAEMLNYYLVAGDVPMQKQAYNARLKTMGNDMLTVYNKKDRIAIRDSKGNTMNLSAFDIPSSNGFINVIDHVIQSKNEMTGHANPGR